MREERGGLPPRQGGGGVRRRVGAGMLLALSLPLAGCMTNATYQDAMALGQVGLGTAGILANVGHGGHVGKLGVAMGAMNVASGVTTLSQSPNLQGGAGGHAGAAMAGPGGGVGRLPDTPECREYLAAVTSARPTMSGVANHAQLAGIVRMYDRCLASAPDHPTSRALQCGKGRYRGYYGAPERMQATCGADGMARASAPFFLGGLFR